MTNWDRMALDVLKGMGYAPDCLANVMGSFTEETGVLNVHADIRVAMPPMYVDINLKPYLGGDDD